MTDTIEKLVTVPFGCNKGIPANVRVAWGARMIAPADLLPDRQGCDGGEPGGPERDDLLDWLSNAGEKARDFCRDVNMGTNHGVGAYSGRSDEVVTLYEDERGKVIGSCQSSHGYVYIAAWLFEHVNETVINKKAIEVQSGDVLCGPSVDFTERGEVRLTTVVDNGVQIEFVGGMHIVRPEDYMLNVKVAA